MGVCRLVHVFNSNRSAEVFNKLQQPVLSQASNMPVYSTVANSAKDATLQLASINSFFYGGPPDAITAHQEGRCSTC
jgi:hypothetical protein